MKSVILSLAVVIGLAGSTAFAGQPYNAYYKPSYHPTNFYVTQPSYIVSPGYNDYCFRHGVKFSCGYYYEGFDHCHWSRIYFDPVCDCKIYCDPCTKVEYYWCVPDHRYYPLSYKPYGKYKF